MNLVVFVLLSIIVVIGTVTGWLFVINKTGDARIASLVIVAGICVQVLLLSALIE